MRPFWPSGVRRVGVVAHDSTAAPGRDRSNTEICAVQAADVTGAQAESERSTYLTTVSCVHVPVPHAKAQAVGANNVFLALQHRVGAAQLACDCVPQVDGSLPGRCREATPLRSRKGGLWVPCRRIDFRSFLDGDAGRSQGVTGTCRGCLQLPQLKPTCPACLKRTAPQTRTVLASEALRVNVS